MIGAVIGDIVGSRFEFDDMNKSRDFEFFTPECDYTDDTVMTIAVAEALMDVGSDAGETEVKDALIKSMKKWGKKYPYAGYGSRFISWVLSDEHEPYGSYGNGSGMRVSSVGWLYDTIERTREVARWTAEITHNHPEGIKGAESVASAIFMARNGASKEEIKAYIGNEFGYDLSRTLDDIRPTYYHVEDCMHTMPEAFECFFEAESYEETIRNVMYIGGDTDTLGAIAGAIAEAFWGIPIGLIVDAGDYIPEDMHLVMNRFRDSIKDAPPEGVDDYKMNIFIKMAVEQAKKTHSEEDLINLLKRIIVRINDNGQAPTPMDDVNNVMGELDPSTIVLGNPFQLEKDFRLRITNLRDDNGGRWIPLFTDEEELHKKESSNIILNMPIRAIIEDGYYAKEILGVVINPFGDSLPLDKGLLKVIVENMGGEE